jgi:tRNA nucleotidyltransferase (CCA-adding enzyme)
MKINELNEAGVGKIVKGVNTTPDVQPGETERQAKKLFPMNKNGKPKSLGVPGATPNQAFNLGLTENMSVTGTETRRAEKKKGIKVGTPEWFKHWFDLPYLREDISKQELLAKLKDQQRSRYTRAMLDAMHRLVKSKGSKHSLGSYAFEISKVFGFDGKELEKMYRDEYMSEDVTQGELNALERVIDGVFGRIGIDVEFTRHFLDRANDDRNGKPITIQELGRLFAKEYKRWGKPIAQMGPDAQAVMKDLESDINIPFVLNWNGEELELRAKTVMRKKNFKTSNKEFPVESVENITKRIFEIAGRTVRVNKDVLEKIIRAQAKELGISFAVARAIAYQESGIKQDVTGDLKLKNKAHGMYQIRLPALQDVNRLYGTNYTIDDIKNDPTINARVGMLYFKAQKEFYGAKNNEQALAGYNGGPNAIKGGNKGANNYAKSVLSTASSTEEKPTRVYDDPKNPNPQIAPPPVPKPKPDYRTQPYPSTPPISQPITDPDGSSGTIIPEPTPAPTPAPTPGISQDTKDTIDKVVKDIVQPKTVTYQDLATASGIADPNKIQAGGKINLPNGATYVIKSGDTLSGIAKNYNKGTLGENVPTTNKPGSIGQHINWAGKNAPDKPKSNVSVARRKQPEPQAWWQTMLQKGKGMFEDEQIDLKKKIEITDELSKLANIFNRGGHEIRIVGGAVRDLALDKTPKDIDLATDATPDEMQQMFDSAGVRHIPTGIEHGTITAVINGEEFEVTTLRADVETDGRRAEVEFVRSWEEDAKRRDLTYNAMSMDFEGNLYDYHGGMDDLQDKVTRFVGDPSERIKEDYLRTLRYFRFQGRLDTPTFDRETMQAIASNTNGLKQLSVERVWMEIGKILSGSNINQILGAMQKTGVLGAIGLDVKPSQDIMDGGDPIINLARITDDESIGVRWKMSNEEKGKLGFLISQKGQIHDKKWYTDQMADGFDRTQLDALARYNNQDDMIAYIKSFKAPDFPVDGNDLMQLGHSRGPGIGKTLQALRTQWKAGNFSASKDELLKSLDENFADGKKPGRKGLSKRVGIPKGATLAQLEKIAKNSSGEKRRMAQWQLNMRRGKNK